MGSMGSMGLIAIQCIAGATGVSFVVGAKVRDEMRYHYYSYMLADMWFI